MTRKAKLIEQVRRNPRNTSYRDLIAVVEACGFVRHRVSGSHHLYIHPAHPELRLNMQPRGTSAKPYQVQDFLDKLTRYNLGGD